MAFHLHTPTTQPVMRRLPAPKYTPDMLILMPNKGMKDQDLKETMEEVHGTVIGSLGQGDLKCYIVKTEKGHLEDTEKKLTKDRKHFATVARNYCVPSNAIVPDAASNPDFSQQWHLQALHCPQVWSHATGSGVKIAVFDSGCAASNPELNGKVERGYDAYSVVATILGGAAMLFPGLAAPGATEAVSLVAGLADKITGGRADSDDKGHGTEVSTCAAGNMNAGLGVGIAPNARIYPVKISEANTPGSDHQFTSDLELIAGMINIMSHPEIRIVNISYNLAYVGFHNASLHPALHVYFSKFFYERSGLIFMSAGNDGCFDPAPPVPYLCVVSGCDRMGNKYDKSNTGPFITFTGPAVDITVAGIDNKGTKAHPNSYATTANGTSFSSPILAGIAALILDKEPLLPNYLVLQRMIAACDNSDGSPAAIKSTKGVPVFNTNFGWGMPDAFMAVTGSSNMSTYTVAGGAPGVAGTANVRGGDAGRRVSAVFKQPVGP
jgi:subtilisin family serine protease